jgi:hypothetical protein
MKPLNDFQTSPSSAEPKDCLSGGFSIVGTGKHAKNETYL